MNWQFLKRRHLTALRVGTGRFVLPSVVFEIEPGFLVGARLDGSARRLRRMSVRDLESGCLDPLPNRGNILNEAAVKEAVQDVAGMIGDRSGQLGLLLPDGVVRVAILPFETLPDDPAEAEALVRWRLRESLPFPADEARLSYQVSWREPGLVELLVVAARSSVLAGYEAAFEYINGGPSLILPATAALLPLLPEEEGTGQLLVHVCCRWVTTVVVTGSRVRFWRHRVAGEEAPEVLLRDIAREAVRAAASSRDQCAVEVDRIWVCARPMAFPGLDTELARATAKQIELLAPSSDLGAALLGPEQTHFARYGATFAGLVSNPR